MTDIFELLGEVVGPTQVLFGDSLNDDYAHDEALGAEANKPDFVVFPESTAQVSAILSLANQHGIPVTARGAGTGLSGAAAPATGAIVLCFERMNHILEVDQDNSLAVLEPGVILSQLDAELAPFGLAYPVYPGEYSASIGGNIATNAGGMRAVKHGVTRHHILGLEAVLASGEVIETGGRMVKNSTGYDLTQLLIGSEGTLAIITKVIVKVWPRPRHHATVLAPFSTLDDVTNAIPKIISSGVGPVLLEYIDMLTMSATADSAGLKLGIPEQIKQTALAYLVVGLESTHQDRLDGDTESTCELLSELGAIDVYVLASGAAAELIAAREKAFWVAKALEADDIIDVVVPRAAIAQMITTAQELGAASGSMVVGCGHAGDGNVHMAVFQKDPSVRAELLTEIFRFGMEHGGAISGEHGIGTEKKKYLMKLEDPAKILLMRGIKAVFDPKGILNPDTVFDQLER